MDRPVSNSSARSRSWARLPVHRLSHRRSCRTSPRSSLRAAVPIAFAALCGVHVRAVRRRQHRHRRDDARRPPSSAGRRASSCCRSWAASPAIFGRHAGPLVALGLAILSGILVSACTPGYRYPSGRTRSSAASIINIAAFGITGYLNTLIAKSSPTGAGAFEPLHPAEALDGPPGRRLDLRARPGPGPLSMSLFVHRHHLPDRSCSGRAGGCARAPSVSTRRRPRPSASTSSACATGTSSAAGVLAGARWRVPEHGGDGVVPAGHDGRSRVHRPGGDDHRALEPARGVRRGAPLRFDPSASASRSRSRHRPASWACS